MVSTIWGICFSLKSNPSSSNTKSFDTVLPRCDGPERLRPDVAEVSHRKLSVFVPIQKRQAGMVGAKAGTASCPVERVLLSGGSQGMTVQDDVDVFRETLDDPVCL